MSRQLDIYAIEARAHQRIEHVGYLAAFLAMIARDWVLIRLHERRTR